MPIDEETGYANWDSADSLNMTTFVEAIRYIRSHQGQLPPTLVSMQPHNDSQYSGVPEEVMRVMQDRVQQNLANYNSTNFVFCYVDGFLLYPDPTIVKELDIKLLIRAPYEQLKARRESRNGYITVDGTSMRRRTDIRVLERPA